MSNSDTMYSIDYQRSIIQLLCINIKFFSDYGSFIKEEYFELQPTRTIFTIISKHILTYEKELDQSDLVVKINEYVTQKAYSNDTFQLLKEEVREIFKVYIKSEQWLIDSLTSFCRRQELINAIHESIDLLSKDPENAYEKVLKKIDNAVSVGMGSNEGLTFDSLTNLISLRKKRYAPEKLFKTGIAKFDEACEGGLAPCEIHCIVAPPKCGKSTLASCIGANGLVNGKTVFHASLEISDIDVANKYAVRLTNMTYSEMNNIKEDTYKQKIKEFEKYKPRLFINHWPEGTANALNIRSWISKMRSKYNVNPDILIIDYDDPLVGETKIPLLNGTEVEIKDLVGKDEFWLYACKEDGTIVPGRGHSARIAREVTELIEITLDNGEIIKSTPNHNHMLRDGTYKRADQFNIGDSLMPLYKKIKKDGYEYIKNNKTRKFEHTYHVVALSCLYKEYEECLERSKIEISLGKESYPQVHHKIIPGEINKFGKSNNDPSNLQWVTNSEHKKYHDECNWVDPEWVSYKSKLSFDQWTDEFREKRSKEVSSQWENTDIGERVSNGFKNNWKDGSFTRQVVDSCPHCNKTLDLPFTKWRSHLQTCDKNPKRIKQLKDREEKRLRSCRKCKKNYEFSFYEMNGHVRNCREIEYNHKVISIKTIKLETAIPVYCLTVDNFQNYALSAGIFTHNCLVPIRGGKDDLYGDAGEIYKDLIGLANLFKIPILTFAQPQREAWELPNKFELIRSYHISHSARKVHRAFSISSLNFADDAKSGTLFLDLNRRGVSGVKIKMKRDLSRGLFLQED